MSAVEPIATKLLEYLTWLASHRMVLSVLDAAAYLDCSESSVVVGLRKLRDQGHIQLEHRRPSTGLRRSFYQVKVMATGQQTRWPSAVSYERVKTSEELQAELLARKIKVEDDRAAHQRHWLAQELHPRAKRAAPDKFFLDRATVAALQGGFA